jgi:hypothetical protein
VRTELDHRLWRPTYLGREATDEELDWVVALAMETKWSRMERVLDGSWSEKRAKYIYPIEDADELAADVVVHTLKGGQKKTKLRKALALEDMLAYMSIDNKDGNEEELEEVGITEVDWWSCLRIGGDLSPWQEAVQRHRTGLPSQRT